MPPISDRPNSREWQIIDTAPRDGTAILLWFNDGIVVAHWHAATDGHAGAWWDRNDEWTFEHPSHWQPLPDPPFIRGASGE